MRRGLFLKILVGLSFLSFLISFCITEPTDISAEDQKEKPLYTDYRVGPENVLNIDVYYGKGEKFSQKVKVSSDGYITFPFLGKVKIGGLTVSEVEQKLKTLLGKDYFVNPQVSVFVEEYSTVSILGEVEKPGVYPIQGNLTVVKLISMAGGFTKIAAPKKVKVIRTLPDGNKKVIRVNVYEIMKRGEKGKEEDILLKPGDIVIVPESIL